MARIVITGGSGFIGTNLIESLVNDGYQILNIDIAAPALQQQSAYWKDADVNDYTTTEKLILEFDPEYIIHLAAVTDLDGNDLEHYKTNIQGTQNIIDVAAKLKSLKNVIYTSSMYVCEPGFIPKDYDTYNPHTVYGESKAEGERLVKKIKDNNYSWVIIRPTSIWGPWFKIPYIDFFNIVYQGKYFDFGRACTKTYGYVENTVFQIKKLLTSTEVNKKTFYLGDLPATQISEWANEISVEMGKGKIKQIPFIVMKTAALTGDFFKAIGLKFPITSFRLKNMTTDNILPLDNLIAITGPLPCTRLEGVKKTLAWLKNYKGYNI